MSHDNPKLWETVKAEFLASSKGGNPGQWSARKAQLSVSEYKKRGGGYKGPKTEAAKSLTRWTEQNWRTKSGKPSLETGERYLPEKAIQALSPQQYAATSKKKKEGMKKGKQFVTQPPAIAEIVKKFRLGES